MLTAGDIIMYEGRLRTVAYISGEGAYFTDGGAVRTDRTDDVVVTGHLDPRTWRKLTFDETVPVRAVLWSDDDGRFYETDTMNTWCTRNGARSITVSVRGGFVGWDGVRFNPDDIMTAPFFAGDVVRDVETGRYGRVCRLSLREQRRWHVYTARGPCVPATRMELAPEGTVLCAHCDTVRLPDSDEEWEEDGTVCPDCFADYTECHHCGDSVHEDDMSAVETRDGVEQWCQACVDTYTSVCNECGCRYADDDDENGFCPDCADYELGCSECGRTERRADAYDWGDAVCPECAAARDVIHKWDYKPSPNFHGNAAGPFYGVELELDGAGSTNTYAAARIMGDDGFLYGKHDGSLGDGFEVVSHPATLDYHLRSAGWDGVLRRALREDYRSHDSGTCGLHVHISRTDFKDEHGSEDAALARLLLIFDMHWSKLLRFSRRTQAQCDRWAARYAMTRPHNDSEAVQAAREFKDENGGSRYYSVNLQNRSTVEIRMFRGSLNIETFYATLEMCDALRRIATETTTAELVGLTWSAMRTRWFDTYQHLPGYLSRRFKDEPQVEEEDEEVPTDTVLGDDDEAPVPDELTYAQPVDSEWVRCTEIPPAGTRVRIRQWDDMAAEYGLSAGGRAADLPRACFHRDMVPLCGTEHTVPQHHGTNSFSTGGWTITPEMIERAATWRPATALPPEGGLARFRQWDDMLAQYGRSSCGGIACDATFTPDMRSLCGQVIRVPAHISPARFGFGGYAVTADMLEVPV